MKLYPNHIQFHPDALRDTLDDIVINLIIPEEIVSQEVKIKEYKKTKKNSNSLF